ncbi:MAG TPA: dihydropteroate synthase [Gemmatimonadaceae bacterium]|nr:dihydropteroate synthase [Gemmatimonadaceae bacterium]
MPAAGAPDAETRPATAPVWRVRERLIALDRPVLAGILNVTPDSFSDGGDFVSPDAALREAEKLLDAGADVLDIGGESTGPGAEPVSVSEELRRVLPVVRAARSRFPEAVLSVDTVKSDVARAALDEGVNVINDVSATRLDERMAAVCAAAGAGLILMHSRGTVSEMASFEHAQYPAGVTAEIVAELAACAAAARDAGVEEECIVLDPGIGFSKRSEHSLAALAGVPALAALGYPVMVGVSRKRLIGEITGVSEPRERAMGTVGVNVMALASGARMFRVHDVRGNRQALDAAWAVLRAGGGAANGA